MLGRKTLTKKNRALIKAKLDVKLGTLSWQTIKDYIRGRAKFEYGIYLSELELDNKTVVYYTSNELHFCTFGVRIKTRGVWKEFALFRNDLKASRNKVLGIDSLKNMDVLNIV